MIIVKRYKRIIYYCYSCSFFFIQFEEFIQDHNKELTRSAVGNRKASDVFLHLIALARRQSEVTLNKVLEKASNSIK